MRALGPESPFVQTLQSSFDRLLADDEVVCDLVRKLKDGGYGAVIFGGWARDILASEISGTVVAKARDIDFVTSGLNTEELHALVAEGCRNLFGGLTSKSRTTALDIWPVQETFLIERDGLPPEFDTLPKVADFNINAVIFKPFPLWREPRLVDGGCLGACRARTIGFQYDVIPFPLIQVARLAIYAAKLGFTFDSDVVGFIRRFCDTTEAFARVRTGIRDNCPAQTASHALEILQKVVELNAF